MAASGGGSGSRPPAPALTPTLSPARTRTLAPSAARGLLAGLGLGRWLTGDPGRRDTETAARNHPVPGGRAEGSPSFKIPGLKPSNFDKKFLLWTGRFKRIEDIPAFVSLETINAARNKMRVKGCFLMVVVSIIGCFATVISGKKAARRHESLTAMNLDKKAKLKASQQAVPKSQ
ncbi:protein FAM162B-like [Amblyraja radiata]|uniref:protein FAM162B-like n=1 Tax=Amblyraja radiata TaxID=386614 RepID=UPI0014024782|nr:protein FAM162B-like [Amblyraja radiata]XP_032889328.1 protein FAM162B-like [Amblyraja radiata]